MISGDIGCTFSFDQGYYRINFGWQDGLFVIMCGLSLLLFALVLSFSCPFVCFQRFGKWQHRAWRIPVCISAIFGILGIVITFFTALFSILFSQHILPNRGFSREECSIVYFYTTYFFLLMTYCVASFAVLTLAVIIFVPCAYCLVRCTINFIKKITVI